MSFDSFLSHNSKDKPVIRELYRALKQRSLSIWLDEEEMAPGTDWHDAIEEIVEGCKGAMVCFGAAGSGPWEEMESKALLRRFVTERKNGKPLPVIPVLLPDAPLKPKLPPFLEGFVWVDLRSGLTDEALDRLQWGITGIKPGARAPASGAGPAGQAVTPPKTVPAGGSQAKAAVPQFDREPVLDALNGLSPGDFDTLLTIHVSPEARRDVGRQNGQARMAKDLIDHYDVRHRGLHLLVEAIHNVAPGAIS